jgi:hypothetical protein
MKCIKLLWTITILLLLSGCNKESNDESLEANISLTAYNLDSAVTFQEGVRITATLEVTNTGNSPVTLTFSSAQELEVIVYDPSQDEVWKLSDNSNSSSYPGSEIIIEPGESHLFNEWAKFGGSNYTEEDGYSVLMPEGDYSVKMLVVDNDIEVTKIFSVYNHLPLDLTTDFKVKDNLDEVNDTFNLGEDIYFELKLTNNDSNMLVLSFPYLGQYYGIELSNTENQLVCDLGDQGALPMVDLLFIESGETNTQLRRWDQTCLGEPVPPGTYLLKAYLYHYDIIMEQEKTIIIL